MNPIEYTVTKVEQTTLMRTDANLTAQWLCYQSLSEYIAHDHAPYQISILDVCTPLFQQHWSAYMG